MSKQVMLKPAQWAKKLGGEYKWWRGPCTRAGIKPDTLCSGSAFRRAFGVEEAPKPEPVKPKKPEPTKPQNPKEK